MEFKQLEAFVAVVDYGSFSEAARKLYLTQPTISAHVRSLEEELHTKLIIRTNLKKRRSLQKVTSSTTVLYACWRFVTTFSKISLVSRNI